MAKKLLEADKSYSIISSSDFTYNIILNYLLRLNKSKGILPTRSMFGKYVNISDTAQPTKKYIVISRVERNDFTILNADEQYVDIFYEILEVDNEQYYKYCKKYLGANLKTRLPKLRGIKAEHTELFYYYMYALKLKAIDKENNFDYNRADYIIEKYDYKGTHTSKEKIVALILYLKNTNETNLFEMLTKFNNDITELQQEVMKLAFRDETPQYLMRDYGDILNNVQFLKNLKNLLVTLLKTTSKEEFILYNLSKIIQ